MVKAFLPPIDNSPVGDIFCAIMPLVFHYALYGMHVQVSPEDLARLRKYKNQRVLLLPNHPSYEDPYVMFDLSRQAGLRFNYVAAREIFEFVWGFQGWVFQHCGVYSIIRGKSDRESFKMTRDKLVKGERPLVIFIEGEVSYENDTLIPFEPGVIQLAFWALEELVKRAKKEGKEGDLPSMTLIPIAMKYFYHAGWEKSVDTALARLEEATGVPVSHGESHYNRIRVIGGKVLSVHERNLGLEIHDERTFDERITDIKRFLLLKMESFLQIPTDESVFALDRVRVIRNRLDELAHTYQDDSELTPYEHRQVEHLRRTFEEFYTDLARVVNFLMYKEGYLSETPNAERTMEFVRRLEKEVFGIEEIKHPRTAVVQLGEEIDLKNHYDEYTRDKKKTTAAVARGIEVSIRRMLASAQKPKSIQS